VRFRAPLGSIHSIIVVNLWLAQETEVISRGDQRKLGFALVCLGDLVELSSGPIIGSRQDLYSPASLRCTVAVSGPMITSGDMGSPRAETCSFVPA
jgi:hypothetical protein